MLVVVQRGHVPRKTGKTGAPGEQKFAIAAAERVAFHLSRLGHRVSVIDADPPSVSHYRGDLFIALHYDSSPNPSTRGASVGYRSAEGHDFADAWKRHYAANGWAGGFRDDNYTDALRGYYGVKRAVEQGTRTALIIEAGFHSHHGDAALLAAPEGPERVARAVAAAVAEIYGAPTSQLKDWFDMATRQDLAAVVDEALDARFGGRWPPRCLIFETGTTGVVWAVNLIAGTRRNLTGDQFAVDQHEALGYVKQADGEYWGMGPETLQFLDDVTPVEPDPEPE